MNCRKITWQSWRLCVFHSPFQYLLKSICKISILLSDFDRQHLPLWCPPHQYCSLRIQFVFHIECFCVDVWHKSWEILRNIVYTCMLLKVLEHCVFWQYDNLNHLFFDLCRDRFFFVTEVPQFPQVTLTFRSRARIFVVNRIIWKLT